MRSKFSLGTLTASQTQSQRRYFRYFLLTVDELLKGLNSFMSGHLFRVDQRSRIEKGTLTYGPTPTTQG
jgi:hypothetical protein